MPNQWTRPEDFCGQKEKVLEFVRAHPECTSADIQESLVIGDSSRIGNLLTRLYLHGLVVREKRKGSRYITWTAVEEDEVEAAKPHQILRQVWTGEAVRDPLVAALFGPARACARSESC